MRQEFILTGPGSGYFAQLTEKMPGKASWQNPVGWFACCVLCEGEVTAGNRCCPGCLDEIRSHASLSGCCPTCAGPTPDPRHPCGHCQQRRPAFERAFAAWQYCYPLDHLLHAAKFRRNLAALALLADLMAESVSKWDKPGALLVLPLHGSRLRERGYNQSEWLAHACGQATGIPVLANGLGRKLKTQSQAGLHRSERRKNIRGAFFAAGDLPDHVAVVDDVMTTGATLDEAARILRRAGVKRVDVWVALRAGSR